MGETLELNESLLDAVDTQLRNVEKQVYEIILNELTKKPNPTECDKIFGIYTHNYLKPCVSKNLVSRAAWFSRKYLIPAVLELEQQLSFQFHKGALFHDTGVAHLLAGDEDGYEYFLAMTDEEEVRKTVGAHKRGTANLLNGPLAEYTITKRMEFACGLLNGKLTGCAVDFAFMTGLASISPAQVDAWRKSLHNLHQFELLRIIHDVEVFVGSDFPKYPQCADNPFVMLRLAKALSHFSQLVESCLTDWQHGEKIPGNTLGPKLNEDKDFGKSLRDAAGSRDAFIGKYLRGADIELSELLKDLAAAPIGAQRQWRLLRILLIVRNSTAHRIEPTLAMYNDRKLLLNLLQVIFASVFTICQLKARPIL